MRILIAFYLFFLSHSLLGQTVEDTTAGGHKIYFTWGYNRAYYNPSDIHFAGENFDFTLYDVIATDIPEPFNAKFYFNIAKITVPQFDFRVGYFLNDKVALSVGWDHMKYRLHANQVVKVSGYMTGDEFGEYEGVYDEDYLQILPSFMQYEHSDGFNFLRVGLERYEPIWNSENGKFVAKMYGGVAAGVLIPFTDFHFLGEYYRNWLHLSGWGVSALMGTRLEFNDYLFLQVQAQCGYTHLGDINIQNEAPSRADQTIVFVERSWSLGGKIPIGRKGK